jgi:hypothetical protein
MSSSAVLHRTYHQERGIHSLAQDNLPNLLRRAQNADGGWGYRHGQSSATEPTAWSILALQTHESPSGETLSSAFEWLRKAQSDAGPWPTGSGKEAGCWVTALACLALLNQQKPPEDAILRGNRWLCDTWPAEGNLVWRFRQRWNQKSATVVRQNHSLRGWGWTPNTASWVEPTAYALILLQNAPQMLLPAKAVQRMRLGEKMLYDRACPGGGWNAGNPLVYGVPGVPRVGPTAWALLALRNYQDRSANLEGLAWLERSYESLRSPGSLALAHLCFQVYGRRAGSIEHKLRELYSNNQFLQSIPVIAWASLALAGVPGWLKSSSQAKDAQ